MTKFKIYFGISLYKCMGKGEGLQWHTCTQMTKKKMSFQADCKIFFKKGKADTGLIYYSISVKS